LFSIFDSGALLTTTIGCTVKYYRNFRTVVNTVRGASRPVGNPKRKV
jgi:hypothetical protein